jgi:hypothetical protein
MGKVSHKLGICQPDGTFVTNLADLAQRLAEMAATARRPWSTGWPPGCNGLRALVEQSIGHLATAWSLRRWRGLLYQARDVFGAAAALISLGRWLHRLPA